MIEPGQGGPHSPMPPRPPGSQQSGLHLLQPTPTPLLHLLRLGPHAPPTWPALEQSFQVYMIENMPGLRVCCIALPSIQ